MSTVEENTELKECFMERVDKTERANDLIILGVQEGQEPNIEAAKQILKKKEMSGAQHVGAIGTNAKRLYCSSP